MFASCQFIAIWMTVAMLLAQAVSPALAGGCGCQHAVAACSGGADCCCAEKASPVSEASCPHCNPAEARGENAEGVSSHSWCDCGHFSPQHPAKQKLPETSESGLKHLLGLMAAIEDGLTSAVVTPAAPIPQVVSSSEELTPHFRQIVLCVWLT
ncbi:hypothetical protein GYB59_09860 [bacterium]|nr:hypothetical protein [bacterium]